MEALFLGLNLAEQRGGRKKRRRRRRREDKDTEKEERIPHVTDKALDIQQFKASQYIQH